MNTVSNKKTCSRCNTIFECNSASIENCQCYTTQLSVKVQTYLQEQYQDCLCKNCLLDIQSEFNLKATDKKN